jgi:hypothetical protein
MSVRLPEAEPVPHSVLHATLARLHLAKREEMRDPFRDQSRSSMGAGAGNSGTIQRLISKHTIAALLPHRRF